MGLQHSTSILYPESLILCVDAANPKSYAENLIPYSDQLNSWTVTTGVTVTTNSVAAPDGSITADTVTYDGTTGTAGNYRIYTTGATSVSGQIYTFSI